MPDSEGLLGFNAAWKWIIGLHMHVVYYTTIIMVFYYVEYFPFAAGILRFLWYPHPHVRNCLLSNREHVLMHEMIKKGYVPSQHNPVIGQVHKAA